MPILPMPFDSRKIYYRSPFGAVEQGTAIHMRVLIPRNLHSQKVELALSTTTTTTGISQI